MTPQDEKENPIVGGDKKMTEPSEKYRDLDFLIGRVGMPVVMCGFVAWFLYHEFGAFRKDVQWKLERSIRNERSIMQKLNIPIILDGDKKE